MRVFTVIDYAKESNWIQKLVHVLNLVLEVIPRGS